MIERLTKCTYRGSWLAAVFLRLFKRALRIVGGALLGFADRLPRTLHSVRILPPVARELVARNAAFRGKHAGRRCFVIGNGH